MSGLIARVSCTLVLIVVIFQQEAKAMSLSESFPNNFCVFSNMEGLLTHQGIPAAGAKLTLQLYYYDEKMKPVEIISDSNGYFNFPSVWKKVGLKRFVPHETHASQEIKVHYKGNVFDIWVAGKHSFDEYSELEGRPVNFTCNLDDEPVRIDLDMKLKSGLIYTNCKWDSIKNKRHVGPISVA